MTGGEVTSQVVEGATAAEVLAVHFVEGIHPKGREGSSESRGG